MLDQHDEASTEPEAVRSISIVPRIAIQAFCVTEAVASTLESASTDRRMSRTHTSVHMGGLEAAIDFYATAPTPNLMMIEWSGNAEQLLGGLEQLADVCDPGTRLMVIGHVNDIALYRELVRRGISEYIVAPFTDPELIAAIGDIYTDPEADPFGRTIAFVPAKGGAGTSTISHNIAWWLAKLYSSEVMICDLDLAFGTAGLDFNQDPPRGIAEAILAPDRVDDAFIERLLTKCTDNLSMLAAPSLLDKTYEFDNSALTTVLETVRQVVPVTVLDIPHVWNEWVKSALLTVDEIVVVASPELSSLRNAKNLFDVLKQARPNDEAPRLVLNQVNLPKRPEIPASEFSRGLGVKPAAIIPFDAALFGTAANNGQMLGEISSRGPISENLQTLARLVSGREMHRTAPRPTSSALGSLAPLLGKLRGQKSA